MSFLIPSAFAAAKVASPLGGQNPAFGSIMMLVIFAAFIYFLLWRPQSKRMKQHRQLIAGVKEGDEVITNGGLVGKVAKIEEHFIRIMIAANSEVMIQKTAISAILPKGTIKS